MISTYDNSPMPITLSVIGAGRGAQRMQPFLGKYNSQSEVLRLDQFIVDPAPGKALVLAESGKKLDLRTSHREVTGETYLAQSEDNCSPAIVGIDDARAIERILRLNLQRVLFIYSLIQLPFRGLTGWQFVLRPEEKELKNNIANFFQKLAEVTAPSGSQEVFEPDGPLVNRFVENLYRQLFAEHLEQNIAKVINHLEPDTPPAEVTFDGRQTSQVAVLDSPQGWRTFNQILQDLQSSLQVPVRRGTNFAILEIGDGIRIHQVRYRVTDGRFAVNGVTMIDPESIASWEADVRRKELTPLNAALLAD